MTPRLLDECTQNAFAGTTTFGQTVGRMIGDGVEWYSANLILGLKIHYAADLSHHQTLWPEWTCPVIADRFSAEKVVEAIRASQKQEIHFPEFLSRIASAGVVSYTVHLKGRKVIYFGRHGDFHIELFPSV